MSTRTAAADTRRSERIAHLVILARASNTAVLKLFGLTTHSIGARVGADLKASPLKSPLYHAANSALSERIKKQQREHANVNSEFTQAQINSANDFGLHPIWIKPDGSLKYPEEDGFSQRLPSKGFEMGDTFDRYGGKFVLGEFRDRGNYASPLGTGFTERSLPPSYETQSPYRAYRVIKKIPEEMVEIGTIRPFYGQNGLGIQYKFKKTIDELISEKYIERINRDGN